MLYKIPIGHFCMGGQNPSIFTRADHAFMRMTSNYKKNKELKIVVYIFPYLSLYF